ncbi:MAG TPA: lysophospholipid acyltransferase family protein, partial [Candidatus Eisenbacteria bacterium]|nr:lysophospholipid acyltransferase family protein [Candidatus Eisenbacteria bacterium]
GIADTLASLGFHLFHGFRTRSVANLTLALAGRLDSVSAERIARRSLRNFFRACVEIAIALASSDQEIRRRIPVSGKEHLNAALAKGKGVIALSAHFGNFFLLGTRLALEGYPVHVLINQPRHGQVSRLMDEYRWRIRQRTIHAKPRREALRELHRALRRNEIVIMIADEYRKGEGLEVPLFGRPVLARRGPATLASRTGAAVVPVYVTRQPDDSLKLIIQPELDLCRPGKSRAEIKENTARMTRWLEGTVSREPEQWNWMNIRVWEAGGRRGGVSVKDHKDALERG